MSTSQTTLFTNCHIWQWDQLTPFFQNDSSTYTPASGGFVEGSFTVDHKTNTFEKFYPNNSPDLTQEMIASMKVINLNGQYVTPGFHDGHVHVQHMAMYRSGADLNGVTSLSDIADRLKKLHNTFPNEKWLIGRGFEHQKFTDQPNILPTRDQLDQIFEDLPIVLVRRCGHIWCCNTIAMVLANLDPEHPEKWTIPQKFKDQMVFDSNGHANGVITEDSNIVIFEAIASQNTSLYKSLAFEFQYLASNGLVAVQNNDRAVAYTYTKMQENGDMAIRSFHTVYFEELFNWLSVLYMKTHPEVSIPTMEQIIEFSATCPKDQILKFDGYGNYFREPSNTTLLSCDRVKLFADGSLGGKTAALRIPYLPTIEDEMVGALATSETGEHHVCKCKHYGMLRETPGSLHDKLTIIKNCGLRVEVHAIGDAAAQLIIKGLIKAGMTGPDHRPVLTHCQFLGADLIEMMHENGVIGNIQPSFLPSDILIMQRYVDPQLYPWAYVWKMMVTKGIVCAGGSDAPVEHVNPLSGIYDAMFRPHIHYKTQNMLLGDAYIKEINNDPSFDEMPLLLDNIPTHPPEPYLPDECMTFAEALQLYTMNCGYSAKCNDTSLGIKLGSIESGYMADFLVFDIDISKESFHSILEANIMQTYVNGKVSFDLNTTKTYTKYQYMKSQNHSKEIKV